MSAEKETVAAWTTRRARGIDRAIAIFEYLHECRQPVRIADIARTIGAPRSTAYDVTNRLVEAGLLESLGDGTVFFGRAMHYYGVDYVNSKGLIQEASKEVSRLAESWGETTQFCMLDGNKYTVVLTDTGRRMFKISSHVGVRVPIPWTASGRLLLSDLQPQQVRDFIPPDDFRLIDGRRLDPLEFIDEIEVARRQGYCVTAGLVDNYTVCMAAPVKRVDGKVVATICFVVTRDTPTARRDDLLAALIESGERLSVHAH